ncbi:hypothetical protein Sste5346_006103 [Sporothrix stenoceras]|uniref:HNH nuclease domain-containing protein n=1 Tax=Sporothrix stenoceras TaxID=5173 RepID=A0ABR3Z1A0_9PEZI
MASPLHHHQAFLEDSLDSGVLIFTNDAARQHTELLFSAVLQQLAARQLQVLSTPYQRIELVRLIYRFAQSRPSKDLTLQTFFSSVNIDMAADLSLDGVDLEPVPEKIVEFTDHLFAHFFLPLKASSAKTPQPTPASLSVPSLSPGQTLPASSHRLSTLRRDCLIRDKNRCVVTRKFGNAEALVRFRRDGSDAVDDEGQHLFITGRRDFEYLEVAHILPHSLMSLDGDSATVTARRNALAILDMFDVGARHLIEGYNIDRPTNALTLTQGCHREFGMFHMYFEAVRDREAPPHTYDIQSFLPSVLSQVPETMTRTLPMAEHHNIDVPLPRLLAIHAAVAKVLHMSGAGEHCDSVLRDTEELLVQADGSTNLGTLAALRLGGWWNGLVV